ncbi:MAG: hypothetical protein LUF92_06625, partial [Clostridiales bacterium]|nr:hypothetical protein [Clostridiales bacterium]
ARNVGIDTAPGKYITLHDRPDYVEQDYFSELDRMDYEDKYLIVFSYGVLGASDDKVDKRFDAIEKEKDSKKRLELLLSNREIMQPWNKRFKRSIINRCHLRFIETLQIGEDFNFCLAYAMQCKTIDVNIKKIYMEDVTNTYSLSRKYRPKLDTQMKAVFQYASETIRSSSIKEEEKNIFLSIIDYLYIRNVFSCIAEEFKLSSSSSNYRKDSTKIKKTCEQFANPLSQTYCNIIHKMLRKLLQRKCYFIFYAVAYCVKGRNYKRYLGESSS